MSDTETMTPAQERMAHARAAKTAAAKADDTTAAPASQFLTAEQIERLANQRASEILHAEDLKRTAQQVASENAAEQARLNREAETQGGWVNTRVLLLGDGKIADGSFGPSNDRFGHYARDDTPRFPRSIAQALEKKGWLEITTRD